MSKIKQMEDLDRDFLCPLQVTTIIILWLFYILLPSCCFKFPVIA